MFNFIKKSNDYQKSVLIWGFTVFIGFVFSQFSPFLMVINESFGDLRFSLFGWFVLTAIALYYQVKLIWWNNIASIGSQITWIVVGIGGWVATYFKLYGYFLTDMKSTTFWLLICVAGMVSTALFNKNNPSYYLLAGLYMIFAVIINFTSLPFELIITGLIFLVLAFVDARLEHSSWRKGLAEV